MKPQCQTGHAHSKTDRIKVQYTVIISEKGTPLVNSCQIIKKPLDTFSSKQKRGCAKTNHW